MADGFELLKAYIALAVKDGDISKVKGQINDIKSALGGLKATGRSASKGLLDVVGAKGFGGKDAIKDLKAQQKEIDNINSKLAKASKLLTTLSSADVQGSITKSFKAANKELTILGNKSFGGKKELSLIKIDKSAIDKEKNKIKEASRQLQIVGEKSFGGKADITGAKKVQREIDRQTTYWQKLKERVARYNAQIQSANERAAAASTRAWQKATREMNQGFQRALRFIGNISLEVGFLAPQFQSLGNILRTGFQFANVGFAAGSKLGGGATAAGGLLGGLGGLVGFLTGGSFAVATKALSVFLGIVTRVGQAIGRVAWNTFASGMRLLFAPTLGLVRAFKLVLQYLPLIVTSVGVGLVQSLSSAAIQMERLRNLFGVAFLGKADIQLQRMIDLADRMGFSFEDAAEPMAKLSFAAQQAGISLSAVDNLFRGVATAASALRLDNERLNRAFVALEQVISKGRVSAEELRQQLAESIPGIVPIVQRALGVTGEEFDKLLRKGELTAKTLIEALGPELERTFRSGAKANADSLSASVARVRNQFLLLRAELGDRIAPAFVKLQLAMLKFARSEQVFGFLQRVTDGLARMFDVLRTSPLIREFGRQFLRIFQSMRQELQDVISKFIRISIVANGSLLLGLTKLAQEILPTINKYLDRALESIEGISGIRLLSIEQAITFVAALSSQFGRLRGIFDAVFDSIKARLAVFFDQAIKFIAGAMPAVARLIAEPISLAIDHVMGDFVRKSREARIKALQEFADDPSSHPIEAAQARSEIDNIKKLMREADQEMSKQVAEKLKSSLEDIKDVWNNLEPPGKQLLQDVADADAKSREMLDNFRKAFALMRAKNDFNNILLGLADGASRAIDSIQSAFSRFAGTLDGTWAKVAGRMESVAGTFLGAGKQFLKDLQSGSNPFFALGTQIGEISKMFGAGVELKDNGLGESLNNFRAEFFDSDAFFKALQGGNESVMEAKKTNSKLDQINKNIMLGNQIRQQNAAGGLDARFRGAFN